MHKGKKILALLLIAAIAIFASCATDPKKGLENTNGTETPPAATTTTTVPAAAPVVVTPAAPVVTPAAPAVVATTPVTFEALPAVSEVELRNLFGVASLSRNDAQEYGIESVLPEQYAAAEEEYQSAQAHYESVMDTVPYDGAIAYPVKEKLENSTASWEALNKEGLPLRVEAERDKAVDMKFQAIGAEAPELAADRYEGAEEYYAEAESLEDSGEYTMAISAYKQAALAYEFSYEKATANSNREVIFANGYAKYSPAYFEMAEANYASEEEYWLAGSPTDLAAGVAALKDANSYYDEVSARGIEYKSYESKDNAAAAKEKADSINAATNASEAYASAEDILMEADANQEAGNYGSSAIWYGDAADAYMMAYDQALAAQSSAEETYKTAVETIAASEETASAEGLGGNPYLVEAQGYADSARVKLNDSRFADSVVDSNEALNYATMSDGYVEKTVAERNAAEAKAAQAQLAADKAEADPAMAAARDRMAWADANNVKTDYATEYKSASSAMTAADMAYSNERYMPAKSLAEEVSATLSPEFQATVEADRAAKASIVAVAPTEPATPAAPTEPVVPAAPATPAAPVAAPAEPVAPAPTADETAAAKTAADADIAKAADKQAWAKSINGMNNFSAPYYRGSGELDAARFAYDRADYAGASVKAKASYESFSAIGEFAPLPATYTVRLIPERRDCLWRIAEYSFVYNNPLKWPVLYEANKKTFKDPSNPNLIFPGQVLAIPSIKGEERSGSWDSAKTYKPLAK